MYWALDLLLVLMGVLIGVPLGQLHEAVTAGDVGRQETDKP